MQRIKTWIRENPHVWWALVLPVYLTLFFIIEHFIKDNYWATQTSIDYHIPFIPQFIVIYDSWSFLLFALGIYLIVKVSVVMAVATASLSALISVASAPTSPSRGSAMATLSNLSAYSFTASHISSYSAPCIR